MSAPARSLRQEQARLARRLREQHKTWAEIADIFRERYAVNARVAFRMVRGWSQPQAAEEWNKRWPAEPKTFKNFSYWELWPARTGHSPSLDVLTRLATLYECRVADLLIDCADFRNLDWEYQARADLAQLPPLVAQETGGTAESISGAEADGISSAGADNRPPYPLKAFVERVEEMSAEELARTVASWAGQIEAGMSRRRLLLKLSAGLSLAAAYPELAHTDEQHPDLSHLTRRGTDEKLAGIWHSRYVYYSSGQKQELQGQHYVVLRQHANRLTGQSLPHSADSRLRLDLSIDGSIATGIWTEQTSPTGYYKGAVYHGTLQLIMNPMGRAMSGRWVGFGKNFKINAGEWELTWVDDSTSQGAMRRYNLKV